MDAVEGFRQVGLFSELSDEDLRRLCRGSGEVSLHAGELLFEEGDVGDRAYLLTEGTVEVLKATGGREALVAVRDAGSLLGEMALLQQEPRMASVRARTDATLVAIPKQTFDRLIDSSPSAARVLFRTLCKRERETSERLRHSERMAQLGTLTAGVAHELNNPAAAVRRAADRLTGELGTYAALAAAPIPEAAEARGRALELLGERGQRPPGGALARSDAEAEVESWLDDRGIAEAWQLAPQLVDSGVDVDLLDRLGANAAGEALADATRFLAALGSVRNLVAEIGDGADRVSNIVRALKGYAYLDQAPTQEVDVVRGLEDTVVLLGHKTSHVEVQREYDPDLPTITAHGSELNQVWTNLIDNACDALADVDDRSRTLTLRAIRSGHDVVVEVEDNGPGIPEDLRPRIFDAFVTTKPPGQGTGLGLQISYRIIAIDHRGELTVDSVPGRTVFRAVLPIEGSSPPGQARADGPVDDVAPG